MLSLVLTIESSSFPPSSPPYSSPQGDEFGRRGALVELSPAGEEEVVRRLSDDGSILLPQVRRGMHQCMNYI